MTARALVRPVIVAVAGLLAMAAAPQGGGFSITTPAPTFAVPPQQLGKSAAPSGFAPAPLPNRDAATPAGPTGSSSASLSPSVFTRGDQYHGEGLSASSSVQSDQERRAKPGAGFNLKMPLQ